MKLNQDQINIMKLIARSIDETGWAKVSLAIEKSKLLEKLPEELVIIAPGKVRFTEKGKNIFEYLQ